MKCNPKNKHLLDKYGIFDPAKNEAMITKQKKAILFDRPKIAPPKQLRKAGTVCYITANHVFKNGYDEEDIEAIEIANIIAEVTKSDSEITFSVIEKNQVKGADEEMKALEKFFEEQAVKYGATTIVHNNGKKVTPNQVQQNNFSMSLEEFDKYVEEQGILEVNYEDIDEK